MKYSNARGVMARHAFGAALVALLTFGTGAASAAPPPIVEITLPGSGGFRNADHITTGPDGNLWFTERNGVGTSGGNPASGGAIGRITPAGVITEFPITFGGPSPGNPFPIGITSGPDGALWFTQSGTNEISRITTAGTITDFPTGVADASPMGITLGPDGNLWFTLGPDSIPGGATDVDAIGRITTAGTVTVFNATVGSRPREIVAGPDGRIWFTEAGTNKIGAINTNGSGYVEYDIATLSPSSAGGRPVGITVGPDPDGAGVQLADLWFTIQDADGSAPFVSQVARINTAGSAITVYDTPTANAGPMLVALGPDPDGAGPLLADIWFTELLGNKIGRISEAGTFVGEYGVPTSNASPLGITAGPDNAIWFTENAGDPGKIGRLDLRDPNCADTSCTTLVVNSNLDTDDGACTTDLAGCTLREAINEANAAPDLTRINFNIPGGGVQTILVKDLLAPTTDLPPLLYPVVIDGTTQPGFVAATASNPVAPAIVLDGSLLPAAPPGESFHGLRVQGGYSTVRGLKLTNFTVGNGIHINKPVTNTADNFNNIFECAISANNNGIVIVADPSFGASDNNTIQGCYITGNAVDGISVQNAEDNLIGGSSAGNGNVISGHTSNRGISVTSAPGTVIAGNKIGIDYNGASLPNNIGVQVQSSDVTIGGANASARNVISANTSHGLLLGDFNLSANLSGLTVSNNYIGVSQTGNADQGNTLDGVHVNRGSFGNITGTISSNVISGNNRDGVHLEGASGDVVFATTRPPNLPGVVIPAGAGMIVRGNLIGTGADGTTSVANSGCGVLIFDYAGNTIGGTNPGEGNTIAFNTRAGVNIQDDAADFGGEPISVGNPVWGNSIFSNGLLGIDLGGVFNSGGDGSTANDSTDPDPGPNSLQNFPVIATAEVQAHDDIAITGSLDSTPSTQFAIDFYANTAADGVNSEGRSYIGQTVVTTDAGGTATITTTISPPVLVVAGSFITATATRITATDGTGAQGDTSEFSVPQPAPLAPGPTADMAATKTDNPDPVTAGSNLTYTITVSNNGPNAATNASWSDTLPAGTTFVSLPAVSGWTCTTPAAGAAGTVSCSNPSFAMGSSVFTLTVAVGPTVAAGTVLSNTATATSDTLDGNMGNENGTAATTVSASADLSIAKGDSPDPVNAGSNLTYVITVTNAGPSAAASASLSDTLPSGTTFVSLASPGGWSCTTPPVGSGGTVSCSNPSLSLSSGMFTLVVAVDPAVASGTVLSNTAIISSPTADPNPGLESSTATTTVSASAVLSITNTDSPDPVTAGNNLTYSISLTNNGPSNAPSTTVSDTLPAGTTFVSATTSQGSLVTPPVGSGGTVTFNYGTINANGSATGSITVNVQSSVANGTVLSDTATATSSASAGASATATTTVVAPAIQLTKLTNGTNNDSAPGVFVPVGSTVTFTYVATNPGGVPLSGVVVKDDNGTPGNTADDFNPTFVGGDTNANNLLDPGETWTYTASRVATAGQYTNLGTASGTPPSGPVVTSSNADNHFGSLPAIAVTKLTNGTDNNAAPGPFVPVGSTVTFTYVVTNPGNVPLSGVTVKDDNGTPGSTADDFNATFVSGDTNNNTLLDTSETWTYTATRVATPGQYTNIGTAKGTPPPGAGPEVSATNSDNHFGAAPSIHLTKLTNGTDNNSPPGPAVPVGSTVTFTYVVTNPGNVPLSGISVKDDNGTPGVTADDFNATFVGGDTNSNNLLDTSETWTYTASRVATAGQYTNVGTAKGTPPPGAGADVTSTDSDNHFGGTPPTPTPTATATATPTASATASPTATATVAPSATATPTATPTAPPSIQAINLSTRMRVQVDDRVGIGGFIVSGPTAKHVLVRAIGPSLVRYGITDVLADPILELHGPSGFVTLINDNWRDSQETQIKATNLAPTNDNESAIDATLAPGAYTAIIRGSGNTSGVALVEVYDLDQASSTLGNLSTRAFVSTGNDIVIAGVVLSDGSGADRIVIRGIGPSLAPTFFPASVVLADPILELRDENGSLIFANNDWQDNAAQAAQITAAGLAPSNNAESAIAVTLPSGFYTALLSGLDNGTGIGIVEVYDRGP